MIALPLLVTLVGLITYFVAQHTKLAEVGRLLFTCGVLVTLFSLAGYTVKMLVK